ncbi:MAG: 8-oxo-dGTP diphosphatase MutT [Sulfurimonas sp.]|nr:MAG: 8-oxo-dGTP diphosphatase MutT [Sulfurimonas sp.]
MKNKVIIAVNIIIINKDKKVLIAKRPADKPMPNKWEFPGGKLEENESLEECGLREIKEELELDVIIDKYLGYDELTYKGQDFLLHIYTAHKADENQILKLNEHTDSKWVDVNELNNFDMPAKDLKFTKLIFS